MSAAKIPSSLPSNAPISPLRSQFPPWPFTMMNQLLNLESGAAWLHHISVSAILALQTCSTAVAK